MGRVRVDRGQGRAEQSRSRRYRGIPPWCLRKSVNGVVIGRSGVVVEFFVSEVCDDFVGDVVGRENRRVEKIVCFVTLEES